MDLLAVQGTLKSRLQYHTKALIFQHSAFFMVQLLTSMYDYWKNHSFDSTDCVGKVMSLLFNMLSKLVIAFLPRTKHLLISWLLSLYKVILESKKIKSVNVSNVSPSICHAMMGLDAMILVFQMLSFKPALLHSSFTFIKRLLSSSSLSAIRVVSSAYLIISSSNLDSACASAWHFV